MGGVVVAADRMIYIFKVSDGDWLDAFWSEFCLWSWGGDVMAKQKKKK